VVDFAGQPVGRIVEVVLSPLSYQPAWVTVACEHGPVVVVPLAAARQLDGCVQLPYTVTEVRGAPSADSVGGHLTGHRAEEHSGYFHALDARAHSSDDHRDRPDARTPGPPRHQAPTEAAAATAPPSSGTEVRRAGGHPRTASAPGGLVPVLLGLSMRTGTAAPVAYPGDGGGPWPALATSSPGHPWWQRHQWRWPSTPNSVRSMRLELRPLLDITGLAADDLDDLTLAASEAAANAVDHAGFSDRRYFDVLSEVGEGWVGILIQDHGRWRLSSGGGDRGHGLYLMSALADTTITAGARGTTVLLRNRPARSA
jgi:anti-sigma regulatory factor (Ser/Thr protein kinase)